MPEIRKVKHKRRFCRVEGCEKIVKSQGLCQRHGAKTRKCKIADCKKQAQGNFDGMCKSHFKSTKLNLIDKTVVPNDDTPPPPPQGNSVYDKILPESIGFTPTDHRPVMPLIQHLQEGFDQERPRGWHRNDERRARGLHPVASPAVQLEGWERELVWLEICVLSGCPGASFRQLARAWGRDKGFHTVLANFICERRGNVERKRRAKNPNGVTKKPKRAPTTMHPSENMATDDFEFDPTAKFFLEEFLGEDPTLGFVTETADAEMPVCQPVAAPQAPMNFPPSKGKRGKRVPLNMATIDGVLTHEALVLEESAPQVLPPTHHPLPHPSQVFQQPPVPM